VAITKGDIVTKLSRNKRNLSKKLEKFLKRDEKERAEQDESAYRRLDFTDHEPSPVLEDEYFGGFIRDREDRKSGDHCKARRGAGPERAKVLNTLPIEERGFERYRQPDKGWAGRLEDEWPPYIVRALAEIRQRNSPPPLSRQEDDDERPRAAAMFNLIRRCEKLLPDEYRRCPAWLGFPTAWTWVQLERARLYYKTGRWLKPSETLELKRMPKLKRVKANPLLTNQYLYGEPVPKPGTSKRWSERCAVDLKKMREPARRRPAPGISRTVWEINQRERKLNPIKTEWPKIQGPSFVVNWKSKKQVLREALELSVVQFLAAGGVIRVYPPEKTAAQLQKRKVGRPLIGERPMTPAEYKRRSRAKAKTLPPQERNEPGAVVPVPLGHAVPGTSLILEIEQMVSNFLEFELAEKYHQYLGEVLDRLAAAPASYILSREEFTIVAAAGVLGRRLLKPAAEFH